jgi:hypothetical protein
LKPNAILAELMLQVRKDRAAIAQQLDPLAAQNELLLAAVAEAAMCGHLHRAIHASRWSLAFIARVAGISPDAVSDYLEGTRGLPSESLDRLTHAVVVVAPNVPNFTLRCFLTWLIERLYWISAWCR